jgi:hypothetical protein
VRDYSFWICSKVQRGNASHLLVGNKKTYRFSARLGKVFSMLRGAYAETFPSAPPMRIGLIVEPRNGASGLWSVAESSTTGPTFVVEVDPALEGDEATLAHELLHPIIRLQGVPTGQSLGPIDKRIGDEFTSTSHHPYIFDALDEIGYGDEQRVSYTTSAANALSKLSGVDRSSPTYTNPPGQTWLALWYFNFYLLARSQYDTIYERHKQESPGVAQKMDLVRDAWMAATKNKGVLKRSAETTPIRAFQSHLFNLLDLGGRVELQSLQNWAAWLFQEL